MQKIVKITRKGQTTIPAKIREQLRIKEGDELTVEVIDQGVVFKRIPKIEDCAGIFAGYADVAELKAELDKLREEYQFLKQVLDSRFLVEYYYSENKEIRQKANVKMRELTQSGNGIIPTIVVCETIQLICSRQGKEKAEMIYLSIVTSGIKMENLTFHR